MPVLCEIPGFPDYLASSCGTIYSVKSGERKPLKPLMTTTGYHKVILRGPEGPKNKNVHRLICETFIGPGEGLQANHLNGNKLDNRFENLVWATNKENSQHAWDTGLNKGGAEHHNSKVTFADIEEIKRLAASGVKRRLIAEQFGVCKGSIDSYIAGKRRKRR